MSLKRLNPVSILSISLLLWLASCQPQETGSETFAIGEETRIISINGSLTEILCEAGLAGNLVGLDITSTYPDSIQSLPKLGYNRSIPAEGVVALNPDLIVGRPGDLKPEVFDQINASGVKFWLFEQTYSVDGTKALIGALCDSLQDSELKTRLTQSLDNDLSKVQEIADAPKVLFVYARGAGSLSVAGKGTQVQEIISLAGGQNVELDFEGFKPLSSEILVQSNPEVILLFESGLNSLAGAEGLLDVPGVKDTDAGKYMRFISMDGQLLTGFGPRLGEAILELNQLLISVMEKDSPTI
ncbi:MAG: ABC transporter substrate-binding protein [Bacteroidota bacterium]